MCNLINGKTIWVSLLGLLLTACSTAPEQPQWLDDPAVNHPSERYLSAVGEAGNRETAANRARANLSQIFQVAIKDSTLDFSESVVTQSGGQSQQENTLRASRFVSADARQVLEGTQIAEYWVDPNGKVFSLAVLDKTQASRRFRSSIRSADRKTVDLVEYANKQAADPVAALRALESARLSQYQRDNTNRNLMVTAGKGITGRYNSGQLEAMIRQGLASLQFSLDTETDDSRVNAELGNAMASLGIQNNPQSAYRLTSKLDTEPLQQVQGWYWLRGSVELSLESNGEIIARQRWPLKVSALEPGLVLQRAKDNINGQLGSYLYQMLTTTNK